jgi:hypothetical protein
LRGKVGAKDIKYVDYFAVDFARGESMDVYVDVRQGPLFWWTVEGPRTIDSHQGSENDSSSENYVVPVQVSQ